MGAPRIRRNLSRWLPISGLYERRVANTTTTDCAQVSRWKKRCPAGTSSPNGLMSTMPTDPTWSARLSCQAPMASAKTSSCRSSRSEQTNQVLELLSHPPHEPFGQLEGRSADLHRLRACEPPQPTLTIANKATITNLRTSNQDCRR